MSGWRIRTWVPCRFGPDSFRVERRDGRVTMMRTNSSTPRSGAESADALLATIRSDLCDDRRWRLLHYLRRTDRPIELDDLVERLRETAEWRSLERRTAAVELHHDHLPRLADFGLIHYDRENRTTERLADPSVIDACLGTVGKPSG